jgi:hypothetical protein
MEVLAMDKVMQIVNFLVVNYQAIITAVVSILTSIIAVSLLIPGDQPEKALQGIADFLSKFSKK